MGQAWVQRPRPRPRLVRRTAARKGLMLVPNQDDDDARTADRAGFLPFCAFLGAVSSLFAFGADERGLRALVALGSLFAEDWAFLPFPFFGGASSSGSSPSAWSWAAYRNALSARIAPIRKLLRRTM